MKISGLAEKIRWSPLVSVSTGFLILFSAAGYWRAQAAARNGEQLRSIEAELNRLTNNVRNGQKLDAHYEKIKQGNENVKSRLVDAVDVATNQQYFYKLEADTGVKLIDLRQLSAGKKNKSDNYSVISYVVSIQGEYNQALQFIRQLESGSRFCRITSSTLSVAKWSEAGNGSLPILSVNINLDFLGL